MLSNTEYIKTNKEAILKGMLHYIPAIAKSETDNVIHLVERMLSQTVANNIDDHVLNQTDMHEFVLQMIAVIHTVTLRDPIYEPHVAITPDGKFRPFRTEIRQVEIVWIDSDDTLTIALRFPDDSVEVIDTINK